MPMTGFGLPVSSVSQDVFDAGDEVDTQTSFVMMESCAQSDQVGSS
jgi:hypothetical protein